MLVSFALSWLLLASVTCHTRGRREGLINSYRLVRFNLLECRDMGAGRLDPDSLEKAMSLNDEIQEALDREHWSRAERAIAQLHGTVDLLVERMKGWDADGDGLSNYAEFMLYGTSWSTGDSDGDGFFDGSEILLYETNPLDWCAVPRDVPVETPVQRRCPALEELR